MEIRNRYILGDLNIKPPFKIKSVVTGVIASPTVAQKHFDLGLAPRGQKVPKNVMYSALSRDYLKNFPKNSRHAWRKIFQADTLFMRKRLEYLKSKGRGLGNLPKRKGRR